MMKKICDDGGEDRWWGDVMLERGCVGEEKENERKKLKRVIIGNNNIN